MAHPLRGRKGALDQRHADRVCPPTNLSGGEARIAMMAAGTRDDRIIIIIIIIAKIGVIRGPGTGRVPDSRTPSVFTQ